LVKFRWSGNNSTKDKEKELKMKNKVQRAASLLLAMILAVAFSMPTFAANETNNLGITYMATLGNATLTASDQDQTFQMILKANKEITLGSMQAEITKDSPIELTKIEGGEGISISASDYNMDIGKVSWTTEDAENLSGITELLKVTFKVPAGTKAGSYNVGVKGLELTKDYGTIWEKSASATATLTITDNTVSSGYTAGLNTLSQEVHVDDTVDVNISVSNPDETTFAAGEVKIQYDADKLLFDQTGSTLGTATVKDTNGTITLEDYGDNKNFGTGVYTLKFTAKADGDAQIVLKSAAFVNKENAAKSDLIAATLNPDTLSIAIQKKVYSVTLPEIFTGEANVVDGANYTFSKAADGGHYDYGTVSATVDGKPVDVIDNGDGTYTINNVTGELVITCDRTPKSYTVTFEGNAAEDITGAADKATYNTNYQFTIPSATGWAYKLESITIGDKDYTGYAIENSVCTIPGTAITGNIIITVTKSATIASVTVEGTGAGAAAGYNPEAEIGKDYTLTITPEAGYTYTVSATMGNKTVDVIDNKDNTYTVKNVTDSIVFTVNSAVIVDGVSVEDYLTLNGTKMWLVKNNTTLADGKVPTYAGSPMFWSEKYATYCYLVISDTLNAEDAKVEIGIMDGEKVTVTNSMDVNGTGTLDASDAQLTFNMYNAVYSNFTDDVTMEKFLRADVNGDNKIDVKDAEAIVNQILAGSTN
jgi:hypothetical protein